MVIMTHYCPFPPIKFPQAVEGAERPHPSPLSSRRLVVSEVTLAPSETWLPIVTDLPGASGLPRVPCA